MKLMRIGEKGNEIPCVLDEQSVARNVSSLIEDFGPESLGDELFLRLQSADLSSLPVVSQTGNRIGAPMRRPRTIYCIGLNYSDHSQEVGMIIPDEPVVFSKGSASFSGPNDDILYSPRAHKLDWEVEVGVVMGKAALNLSEEQALDHIFGYTLVNDVSERAWQTEHEGQWIKGKSFPSFCPTGPFLVTKDEIPDIHHLDLWLDVNGKRQQASSTRHMIFSIPFIISYLSHFTLLEAGDLICTGTPHGVGMGQRPQKWLAIGDIVTLGATGLGEQCQHVVAF